MRILIFYGLNFVVNILTLFVLIFWFRKHIKRVNNFLNENSNIKDDIKSLVSKVSNIERVVVKHERN